MTAKEFENRYQFGNLLGKGGFSKVFKAFDKELEYYVAIKRSDVDPKFLHFTLKREVELANKLEAHTNIARYDDCYRFNYGPAGDIDFAVLKYYDYGNLEEFLRSHDLQETDKRRLIKGILRGIGFLHQNNIIHRDLKAQNVLIDSENGVWIPKITDFGLSREVANDNTVVDTSIGVSYAYAAPEQILNNKISKATDLWAVGVLIYRIMADELPFRSNTNDLKSHEADDKTTSQLDVVTNKILKPEFPVKLNTLPEPYQNIIRKCWVLDPHKRVQSADELLQMLSSEHQPQNIVVEKQINIEESSPTVIIQSVSKEDDPEKTVLNLQNNVNDKTILVSHPVQEQPPLINNIPPEIYIDIEKNRTQILNRTPSPAPAQKPNPSDIRIGEPERKSVNWVWLVVPIALGFSTYIVYRAVHKDPVIVPSFGINPPIDSTLNKWQPIYEDALSATKTESTDHHHNKAFAKLFEAAKLAINSKQASVMLERMEKDSAENRAVTGKLINGHTDWNLIEKALMSNDSLVLNEPIKTNTLSHTAATSNTIHSKATKKNMESTSKPSEDVIYSLVNQSPKYPGGDAGLFQWLRQHIKYPRIARENNIEGKVYVGFVVETDGSITNVDVKRGIGSGCNDEAVRVISSMPKWTPGFKDGKAVRVAYTLPIIFKLE